MLKKDKKEQRLYIFACIALCAVMVVLAATFLALRGHEQAWLGPIDLTYDKDNLAQIFTHMTIPPNLSFVSKTYAVQAVSDSATGTDYKEPQWTYEYTVSGPPSTANNLSNQIINNLTQAGYHVNNVDTIGQQPDITATKPTSKGSPVSIIVYIEFNHTIKSDIPLSSNYPVYAVTYVINEQ